MALNQLIPISVTVLCYNSERTLSRCLSSLQGVEQIIVLDSGSTDQSQKIATGFDRVEWHRHEWLGFAKQKQLALTFCQHDWVLNLDSDESLDPKARAFLAGFDWANQACSALTFGIHEHFLRKKNHVWTKSNRKIRCFRKSRSSYSGHLVHEGVIVEKGDVIPVPAPIHHYGEVSHEIKVSKINTYSSLKAMESSYSPIMVRLRMLGIFPLAFLRSYIAKRQFLNGFRGFSVSMINGFYAYLKAAKCYENMIHDGSHCPETTHNDE